MTLCYADVATKLIDVPNSQHQPTNLTSFWSGGWECSDEVANEYWRAYNGDPFRFMEGDNSGGYQPRDRELDVQMIHQNRKDYVDDKDLEAVIAAN